MLAFQRLALAAAVPMLLAAVLATACPPAASARSRAFPGPVPPPVCQPGDRPEKGLDGQLTQAERASGASTRPYNCNLAIVGEYAGQGAGHQLMWYDHCAYVTTEGYEAGQKGVPPLLDPGIQVLEVSHQRHPRYVTHLDNPAALYDWEDGAVNSARALLGTAESWMGSGPQPAVAFYSLTDCAHPRLLSSVQLPDPDLVIRTSGEYRISNFLLWELAYSELVFSDILWPDFRREHLLEAVREFQARDRRYGNTGGRRDDGIPS